MMAIAPMNAESTLFTLKLSSDVLRFSTSRPAAANGRAGRGSYANTTAMAGRIYRLDVGDVMSGPYKVDNGSI